MKSKPTWAPSSRTSPLDASISAGMNVGSTVTSTWYGTCRARDHLGQAAGGELAPDDLVDAREARLLVDHGDRARSGR